MLNRTYSLLSPPAVSRLLLGVLLLRVPVETHRTGTWGCLLPWAHCTKCGVTAGQGGSRYPSSRTFL